MCNSGLGLRPRRLSCPITRLKSRAHNQVDKKKAHLLYARSVCGQDNRILLCDWLPEWARWRYLVTSGLPAVSSKKIMFIFHIINPLLTKLVLSRWLDIGLVLFFVFFCVFMALDSVSVHNHE